ncbi:hypothetical protein [Elizabethkingia bruuniana]|uniref:hypothetical protein n=1 Tax=Elizabethkingia bruuniana TaxID=1756149 RepID=UPI00099958E7|nr:hypothetical protein [Elizabethkingia bruuniana]OPC53473.1 hypothetical protein BAY07_15595 [Elizabethkingia bruuniana]
MRYYIYTFILIMMFNSCSETPKKKVLTKEQIRKNKEYDLKEDKVYKYMDSLKVHDKERFEIIKNYIIDELSSEDTDNIDLSDEPNYR